MNRQMTRAINKMAGKQNFSPMQIINGMMQNPQIANNGRAKRTMELLNAGDRNGLIKMAENIAKENGTSFESVQNQFKQRFF